MDPLAFILSNTEEASPLLCPEIRLALITESCALWEANAWDLEQLDIGEPYWAFPWAAGQALARHVLDHPSIVRGCRVLDFGSGSGMVAIAAALAGASEVLASDVDPFAIAAIRHNAALNGVHVETTAADLVGCPVSQEVVLAGDMTYEEALTRRVMDWLRALSAGGTRALLADAGRGFALGEGVVLVRAYTVPDDGEPTGRRTRTATVNEIRVDTPGGVRP